jgi:IS30 family transposase
MITKIKSRYQLEYLLKLHGSDAAIARSLGVTRQAIQRCRRKYKVPANKNRLIERNNDIRFLSKKGYTIKELAMAHNLSQTQIRNILKRS